MATTKQTHKLKAVFELTVFCPKCDTGHLDSPGSDETWTCRRCGEPIRRAVDTPIGSSAR